jgi:carbamoyl-phosphate synthase L subunit-like protein
LAARSRQACKNARARWRHGGRAPRPRSGLGGDGPAKRERIGTEVYGDRDILPRDVISRKLSVPNAERIFFIRHALRAGFTEIFNLTKIDRWFLVQIKEIVDFEEELAGSKN